MLILQFKISDKLLTNKQEQYKQKEDIILRIGHSMHSIEV
jgi:hypothetical protein